MADIGQPERRITVVPMKHPVPGIEDPKRIPSVEPAEPSAPVEPEKVPEKEPV